MFRERASFRQWDEAFGVEMLPECFHSQFIAVKGSSIGLRTLNERINQIAPLLEQAYQTPITQVPTGTIKTDRCGRRRGQHKGKRMVLLVALGWWADDSGMREILDGELAEGEMQPDWQRGVRPEAGLQAVIRDGKGELGAAVAQVYGTRVIEQRCVFHKLPSAGRQSARRPRLFTNLYP